MVCANKLMLVKFLFLFIFCLAASPLRASSLSLEADVAVNSVTLTWQSVEGTSWYDIYNGDAFVVRLPEDENSYTLSHLDQNESYRFVLGARDSENQTLDAEAVSVKTGSYDGVYEWINPTDDDNHGRMDSVTYRAELAEDSRYGQYMRVSIIEDGQEHVIFPLQDFDSSWNWIDYDSSDPAAVAYRLNCEKFNVLGIKPGRFKIDKVTMTNDSISVDIRTSALGISVVTTTTYEFSSDDEGPLLRFTTTGSGLAKSALFRNPADPDNPYTFTLRARNV